MQRCLETTTGPYTGTIFILGAYTKIGRRGDNDIQIVEDPKVSRYHAAVFENDDGHLVLQDNESRNGTFIGEESVKIGKCYRLRGGDRIVIGASCFRYLEMSREELTTQHEDKEIRFIGGLADELTETDARRAPRKR